MKNLSAKWQKLIIWLTGYLNLVAFVLCGGFFLLKTEDEDVKKTAKTALIVVVIFAAIDLILAVLSNAFYAADVSYMAMENLSIATYSFRIIEAIAFVAFIILDLCGVLNKVTTHLFCESSAKKADNATEENAKNEAKEDETVAADANADDSAK